MRYALSLVLALTLTGCGLELLGATAIQSGMQAENAKQATQALHHVRGTTNRLTAERAIDAYHAEKGAYPPSLQTLVDQGYLAGLPALADGTPLGYDPATGELTEPGATTQPAPAQSAQPAGPAADDRQKLAAIQQALREYRMDNGAYPSSLYALVPSYLEMLPTPANGQNFAYDPATGAVSMPGAATPPSGVQARQPQQRGYGAGTTPMVENMTGLGAQQELNRMGHGGTNQAGARSRQRGQSIPDQHTQRQMETMDELGL